LVKITARRLYVYSFDIGVVYLALENVLHVIPIKCTPLAGFAF